MTADAITYRRPVPVERRVAVRDEHAEQKYLIEWCRWNEKRLPELRRIFAIPNGGARSKATAGKLKAEGVRPGVFDLCLPVARGGFFGLFLEMKAENGRASSEQLVELNALDFHGYLAAIVHGQKPAIDVIEWYLAHEPTRKPKRPIFPWAHTGVKPKR